MESVISVMVPMLLSTFLYDAGQTLWQCLPLGPTGFGDSPYQAFSAFAGQPLLISPDLLLKDGLLEKDDLADVPDFNDYSVEYGNVITYKTALLRKACAHFTASEDKALHKAFNHFCRTEKDWLEDYALFMSLKDLHQVVPGMNGRLSIRFWIPGPGRPH